MLQEDIYVLGSQNRSLLDRRASVDTLEYAEIHKRDDPKLFVGLEKSLCSMR